MSKWSAVKEQVIHQNPHFEVVKDVVVKSNGKQQDYWFVSGRDGVMIVPIKVDAESGKVTYYMVEQYRHPAGEKVLEFPRGGLNPGEGKRNCAERELLEETGFTAKWLKFLYQFCNDVANNTAQLSVYLALVDEDKGQSLEYSEQFYELNLVEVGADEILRMIQNNEIRDSHTLAALNVAMLQTDEAKRYLEGVS